MLDLSGVLANLPSRESIAASLVRAPATTGAVSPFVPGETVAAAVRAAEEVQLAGMSVAVLHLPAPEARASARLVHLQTIEAFQTADVAEGSDLMVDLADLGLSRGVEAGAVTADLAAVCRAADQAGMTVTLAGLAHEHVATGRSIHSSLLRDHPDLGITLQASLLRCEADCADLARSGVRVRLVRQEADQPKGLSFANGHEIDKSYVRCMRHLMAADCPVVIATHDPRLMEIAGALAARSDRDPSSYSFQFRLGVRPEAAAELASGGARVSVLVPFGPDWSTYLSRRIALKPNTIVRAVRAAVDR